MTLAHISDTHLGYRAYGRTTPSGFNQREVDVMKTFQAALASIEQRDPDLVVHAGDMFHIVRPSNATIVQAFKAISEFQSRRSGRPFVIVGGNHDATRGLDQLEFTAPAYVGVVYSLTNWICMRLNLHLPSVEVVLAKFEQRRMLQP